MISVIMPTFNEAGNIKELILRTARVLGQNFEIIVVDDNSPDKTADVVKKLQTKRKFLRLIINKGERSLPLAVNKGVQKARGEIVAWFDCDLSMPPEKLPEMINLLKVNDIVIGSTLKKGGKDLRQVLYAQFFHLVFNKIAQMLLGGVVTDYTSGYLVAKRKAISGFRFDGVHGSYFIKLMFSAQKRGLSIAEIPYEFGKRYYGESKISRFFVFVKTGMIYLKTLVLLRLR